MKVNYLKSKGVTLIELLVALVASLFLLGGVSMAYSSIKSTELVENEIENSLNVIRYSNNLFSRSLKHTSSLPIIKGQQLWVSQQAGTKSCTGKKKKSAYIEHFTFEGNALFCDVGQGKEKVLIGLSGIEYTLFNNRVSIAISPIGLPDSFNGAFKFDIALSQLILQESYN